MGGEVRVVRCPQCGAPVPWTPESLWRPFCSERCKMIDLGAWANERYRLPDQESGISDQETDSGDR